TWRIELYMRRYPSAPYLTSAGTAIDPTARRTTMAAPTTARRTRSFVKYGTRSRGIDGSADSISIRPARPLTTWLRAPRDISTARTRAWSPPTRACETLRVATGWVPAPDAGVRGPAGRAGGRNLRPFFFPFRITVSSLLTRHFPAWRGRWRAAPDGEVELALTEQAGGGEGGCWVVEWDAKMVAACLSLGRGTQRSETLATICCVPRVVIALNVVGVKAFNMPLPLPLSTGFPAPQAREVVEAPDGECRPGKLSQR